MDLFSIDTKTLLYQLFGRELLFKVVKNHSKRVSVFSYNCSSSASWANVIKISANTDSGLKINFMSHIYTSFVFPFHENNWNVQSRCPWKALACPSVCGWSCKFACSNTDGERVLLTCLNVCTGFRLLANLAGWILRVCFQKPHGHFVFKFALCEYCICIWKLTLKLS